MARSLRAIRGEIGSVLVLYVELLVDLARIRQKRSMNDSHNNKPRHLNQQSKDFLLEVVKTCPWSCAQQQSLISIFTLYRPCLTSIAGSFLEDPLTYLTLRNYLVVLSRVSRSEF